MIRDPDAYPSVTPYKYLFTVFIPTYNRAELLVRALDSVAQQTFGDCEVLIVDDGSTDRTREAVAEWSKSTNLHVNYVWQENQGKPAAYNNALDKIHGYFTVPLDSDDQLVTRALEILKSAWEQIPVSERGGFAGVEGLCVKYPRMALLGERFPKSPLDANFIEVSFKHKRSGETRHALRTDVMKEYPFPVFSGEKHMRESVIWCRMAHRYRFRYINETIQILDQQPDSLSRKPFERRTSSPNSFRLAFREMANDHCRYCTFRQHYNYVVRYVRYSWLAKVGLRQQVRQIDNVGIWWLSLLQGSLEALWDRIRMSRHDAG